MQFFGKRKTINRQEIDRITTDQNRVRYSFMNKQNQQLFGVSINMVDAVAFIQDILDELEKEYDSRKYLVYISIKSFGMQLHIMV